MKEPKDQALNLQYFAEEEQSAASDDTGSSIDPIAAHKATMEKMGITSKSDEDGGDGELKKQSYTLMRGGKQVTVELTSEELLEHLQKGYDYTSKTQEVAEERRKAQKAREEYERKLELIESEYGLGSTVIDVSGQDDSNTADDAPWKSLEEKLLDIEKKLHLNELKDRIGRVQTKYGMSDAIVEQVAKFGDNRGITDFEVAYLAFKGANPGMFQGTEESVADMSVISPVGVNDKTKQENPLGAFKRALIMKSREDMSL